MCKGCGLCEATCPKDGDIHHLDIPPAVVGLVSGGIRNQEHLEVAEAMRKSCQMIVALGTCATHGGLPSLINGFHDEDLFERYYRGSETTNPHANPTDPALPPLLDRTYALVEVEVIIFCRAARRIRTRSPRPSSACSKAGPPFCPQACPDACPPSGKARAR